MNIKDFNLAWNQILNGLIEPEDYPSDMGDLAHHIFEHENQKPIASVDVYSSYPTQIFELEDGYVAITCSGYEISSTGDDFIGIASTWRRDYV